MKNISYIIVGLVCLVVLIVVAALAVASRNVVITKKFSAPLQGSIGSGTAKRETSIKNGFARYVIQLPQDPEEEKMSVHLIIGKNTKTDHCNHVSFVGEVVQKQDQTDGDYLELETKNLMNTTIMECGPEDQERFVSVEGEGLVQPYPSQKPLIIYVPEGFEVRFAIEKK